MVIVPDLYWRQQPGVYLSYDLEGQQRGRAMGAAMDWSLFIEDLHECAEWLRQRPDCTGRIGTVGFCLGGKLVWLGLSHHVVDANVAYYAAPLADHLDAAKTIDRPLMMHFGALDHRVPPDLYAKLRGRLAGKPHAHTNWYEGVDHGFDRNGYRRITPRQRPWHASGHWIFSASTSEGRYHEFSY